MITPIIKDDILKYLINKFPDMHGGGDYDEWAKMFSVSSNSIKAIMRQFVDRRFIDLDDFIGGGFIFNVYVNAHDFILSGGYQVEVEIVEKQFAKLKTEIYSLEKTLEKNKFDKLMSIINTIVSTYSVTKGN